MSKSKHSLIRSALREAPDGLDVKQIASVTQITQDTLRTALADMPDAYIDRWMVQGKYPPRAVWCVVVPPEDCPRPAHKEKHDPSNI